MARATSSSAYVTQNGGASVSQFDIGAGGLLSAKAPSTVATGSSPEPVVFSPDGKSAYVGNDSSINISQFDVGAGGLLSPKTPATAPVPSGGSSPRGGAVSPDGKSVYFTVGSAVAQYDVSAGGLLSPKTPATAPTGTSPRGVAVSPNGKSVYVINAFSNSVSQFDVGAGGLLSAKTPATAPTGTAPVGVAVSPDGKSVYVTNQSTASNSVSQFDVGAGGVLSAKTPAAVSTGTAPETVAVSPDGKSAYVTNRSSNNISQFDVGAGGSLSAKTPATVSAGTLPFGLAVRPDGKSVYVTNVTSNNVSQFDVGAGGLLSAKTPTAVPVGNGPAGVAVLPDQGPVASFAVSAGPAGSPSGFDGSASSDTDGTLARYDWDFGDGSVAANAGTAPSHSYAQPGTYTARLTVTDDGGCSTALVFTGQTASCNPGPASTTRTVTIVASALASSGGLSPSGRPTVLPDTIAPGVSGYRVTNNPFVVAGGSTPTFGSTAAQKRKRGTTIGYALSESATVKIAISQRGLGRRSGSKCVAPTKKLAKAKKCTRIIVKGTLTRASRLGSNSVAFTGKIGSKALSPGRYQATLTATDRAANTSKPKTITLTIVKR